MSLRTRILVIVSVLVLCSWVIYPPAQTIKLGLDLKGGVHLVLHVDTNDALRNATAATAERIKTALERSGVPFTHVEAAGIAELVVSGVPEGSASKAMSVLSEPQFEPVPRPDGYLFRMHDSAVAELREQTVQQALDTIERRVNELGVAEATVARYTGQDQILVQLPGVSDVDAAKRVIQSTAQLRLTLVEGGPFRSRAEALEIYAGRMPADLELLPGRVEDEQTSQAATFYVVRRAAALAGDDVRHARASRDEYNRPAVAFTLQPDAASRFGVFTGQHIGRQLATVIDDRVASVATVESRIDAEGQIAGVSRDEMIQQVINLRSGALPADLEYVEERQVGATLGRASVRAGIAASIGGLTLIALFMTGYYKRAGLNALVSILLNLLILIGLVAYVPVTLTLPGIAGLVLTIGMGVDSNVLIFERIKEELAAGRAARSAVHTAFTRVWITIVDTHVASLLAAAFLYQFGTMPIRGFATTLTLGLLANVFTAVFVSKTVFLLLLRRDGSTNTALSIGWSPTRSVRTGSDLVRWRWPALAFSLVLIAIGGVTIVTRGLPLGIDFSGGTLVVVDFGDTGVSEDRVRGAIGQMSREHVVQRYGSPDEHQFLIRLPLPQATAQKDGLEVVARQVSEALTGAQLAPFEVASRELVTATIGEDLRRRGIYATIASIVAITAYIGLRFRFSFAVGAMAATLHDILVTFACLALAGYDLSLNVTAALLAITGYSVNDTIVVFDRVRENLRLMGGASLDRVISTSVSQTLSRTIITAGTTFLAALSLFLFGGEALEGFAFTMLVGIASGTYSTIFIASALARLLSGPGRLAAGPHDRRAG